ncbi:hypothetical protein GCM10010872_21200 [Dyella flava]|nr:hypothetical protein GCM10010872_21200 [Dyella flava]
MDMLISTVIANNEEMNLQGIWNPHRPAVTGNVRIMIGAGQALRNQRMPHMCVRLLLMLESGKSQAHTSGVTSWTLREKE